MGIKGTIGVFLVLGGIWWGYETCKYAGLIYDSTTSISSGWRKIENEARQSGDYDGANYYHSKAGDGDALGERKSKEIMWSFALVAGILIWGARLIYASKHPSI